MSDDKGFLSRWSERKRQVAAEEEAIQEAASVPEPVADPHEGKTDEEILAELELPEPESLKLGDRVEAFMAPEVPERIRARALRAFWRTNPILANVDGLDDYCDDFTDAAFAVENIQTVYEVGKGYARKALDTLEKLAEDDAALPDAVSEVSAVAKSSVTDESIRPSSSVRIGRDDAQTVGPEKVQISPLDAETEDDEDAKSEERILIASVQDENDSHLPAPLASRRMRFRVS